jgi:hypothetical protein
VGRRRTGINHSRDRSWRSILFHGFVNVHRFVCRYLSGFSTLALASLLYVDRLGNRSMVFVHLAPVALHIFSCRSLVVDTLRVVELLPALSNRLTEYRKQIRLIWRLSRFTSFLFTLLENSRPLFAKKEIVRAERSRRLVVAGYRACTRVRLGRMLSCSSASCCRRLLTISRGFLEARGFLTAAFAGDWEDSVMGAIFLIEGDGMPCANSGQTASLQESSGVMS